MTPEFWQFIVVVFSAGVVWERLNALNKKIATLNGKVGDALVQINELRTRVAVHASEIEVLQEAHAGKGR